MSIVYSTGCACHALELSPLYYLVSVMYPVPDIYFAILRVYLFVSALVLFYKFYIEEKDNIFAIIFAMIAIIYNPIFFISFGNEEINTGHIIFVLTIALFVLGYNKIKD